MQHVSFISLAALAIAASLAGCAAAPPSPAAAGAPTVATPAATPATGAAPHCDELAAQIVAAEQARRTALEKGQDAWQAVIPFAVAARWASSKSAAADAEQRLAQLRSELDKHACARAG